MGVRGKHMSGTAPLRCGRYVRDSQARPADEGALPTSAPGQHVPHATEASVLESSGQ